MTASSLAVAVLALAVIASQAFGRAAIPTCHLAGAWHQTTEVIGSSTWTIQWNGKAQETGLGNARGEAALIGNDLIIHSYPPSDPTYNGDYEWTLDRKCNGVGTLTFTHAPREGETHPSRVKGPPPTEGPASKEHCTDPKRSVKLLRLDGDALFRTSAGDWTPARSGMLLCGDDEISTGPDSKMVLTLPVTGTVEISEMTTVVIADLQDTKNLAKVLMWLKMGELRAKEKPQETIRMDFSIKSPTATAGVRGTAFTIRYDPATRATSVAVTQGAVSLDPIGSKPPLLVKAGQAATATPAGAKSMPPATFAAQDRARALVLDRVAKAADACKLAAKSASVAAGRAGATVTVQTSLGSAVWTVVGPRATAANALAKRIDGRCTGAKPSGGGGQASVLFTQPGTSTGARLAAPASADGLNANISPQSGVIANAYWLKSGKSLGRLAVPAGATGLVFTTAPGIGGTLLTRPKAATGFHLAWSPSGVITSASWWSVGKQLATIPVTAGQRTIGFTSGAAE